LPPQAQPPLRRIGRKQRATLEEIRANPRARSALLRVAERIGPAAQ
jgi:16S rRNA (cytosine1402-N4)-methyltransferase